VAFCARMVFRSCTTAGLVRRWIAEVEHGRAEPFVWFSASVTLLNAMRTSAPLG
jgi:hypothetical protein